MAASTTSATPQSKWGEKKSWGDETEDNDTKDQKGAIRTLEPIYRKNDAGQTVKITRRVRIVTQKVRVNKNVAMRKKWAKFGDCKGLPDGAEEGVTDFDRAVIVLDLRARKRDENKEDDPFAKLGTVGGSVVVCRNCGETGHWTLKCPKRGGAPSTDSSSSSGKASTQSAAAGGAPGKYVPVHQREGPKRAGVTMLRDDTATLRVTNLSEDTSEQDLAELFRPFGHTSRIYLAKDRKNGASRGFAFINYSRHEDAQRAIGALDGHGYGHLILRVEWAKPREEREEGGGEGGEGGAASSGRPGGFGGGGGFGSRRM